ncbi:hypothetical protein [Bacillus subtilis]|uniref:hypothetical protein n=1 Tax=Bacillus subtilis TaxID=1423 RepID=UPI00202A5C6B|nr:hypothetical protein [Bacillus subtilis]
MLRAKVLYGTQATKKKPKYTEEMNFSQFNNMLSGNGHVITLEEPDEFDFITCGVDLTTLSEILERGDF